MKKEFIIAGNWKMYKNLAESQAFFQDLDKRLALNPQIKIIIFPPFTALDGLKKINSKIAIGAQNIYFEKEGAYTGEISAWMLKDLVEYVLCGHSERRHVFGENDETINKKVKSALTANLNPVLCVGETLSQRQSGQTNEIITHQITKGLQGVSASEIQKIIIAYEPVWAIGTGINATPAQAQEVQAAIRSWLKKMEIKAKIPILYGGSVKPENSSALLSQPDINGLLIGGASLKVDSFFDIIQTSYRLSNL